MKTIKNIIGVLVGLFILYLVVSFGWSFLNMQSCSLLSKNTDPTCEQIAENNANNCKYIILRWKKVDYNRELQKCKTWEQNKNK